MPKPDVSPTPANLEVKPRRRGAVAARIVSGVLLAIGWLGAWAGVVGALRLTPELVLAAAMGLIVTGVLSLPTAAWSRSRAALIGCGWFCIGGVAPFAAVWALSLSPTQARMPLSLWLAACAVLAMPMIVDTFRGRSRARATRSRQAATPITAQSVEPTP